MVELTARHIQFAKALAHTSRKVRERTLSELQSYVSNSTHISDLEMLGLHKGLFYCMWLADKTPVQLQLAERIAALIKSFSTPPLALLYVQMFFRTILREWAGLDYLRVDKFLKLVRIFTQHIFDYLQQAQWDPDLTRSFVSCLREEVLTKTPNGLRLHVADVFLPELCAAASSSIDTRTLLELLQPFLEACSKGTDEALQKRITKNILREFATSYARELPRTAEAPRFVNVDTKQLQAKIFAVATHATTKNKFRSALHYVHKYFQEVTRVKLAHLAEEPADTIAREDSRNEDSTAVAPPTDMFETKVKLLEPRVETPSTFQPAHQSAEHATLLKRKKKRAKIEKGTMQTVTDVAHASTTDPAQSRNVKKKRVSFGSVESKDYDESVKALQQSEVATKPSPSRGLLKPTSKGTKANGTDIARRKRKKAAEYF